MFPIKYVITKLKHIIKARGAVNQVIFGALLVALVWLLWRQARAPPQFVPTALRRYLRFPAGWAPPPRALPAADRQQLQLRVERLNLEAEVFASPRHTPVTEDTTIIAIQVHRDAERLQYLIISLAQVYFIEQALLVFSHSYYDEEINALVHSIDFCKYMQIFYPNSLQLHPDAFPGVDPDDCAGRVGTDCFDRDARRTEHKHHWWWKAHFIFDGLDMWSLKRLVLFLEEDDYVLPDLLYMLRYARRALAYFPEAEVIALGRPYATDLDYDKLIVDVWTPLHDRALAFNLSTWHRIKAKASLFCMYDDCSWSYSLMHLFGAFPRGLVEGVASLAPRALRTRALGGARAAAAWGHALARRAPLFPAQVRAVVTVGAAGRVRRAWRAPPRGNGGWADLRDQMLCLDPVTTTTPDYTTSTPENANRLKNISLPT